ncbi:MAG: hypothetical protein E5V85_01335 [Mesorhizobium sp.]|nr:MAG: hypothetical protein EOS64_27010 [Mesorhizobium sp.]TGS20688.1 hypothetical protein EN830_31860 [Mesorhizobium sp. M1C.F.Ca.ET.187.01.1.1]TGU46075.1 hypothetical protein EN795_32955 [bacterium M00.F.Ca.ET.152.01.1.1]TGV31538.1 hypothetical protein EN829_032305 [Mesorhizobium sp. M00.F.Ca.ET.186.01.1.1]RWF59335.1 MAG: hypothetical protein EOS47_32600 [Mesorhizobium sp.]
MPAALDEAVDGIAHLPAPIFVVADDNRAAVAIQQIGEQVEIVLRRHVHPIPVPFGPDREMPVIGRPAGGCIFFAVAVGARIAGDREHGCHRIISTDFMGS